MALTVGYTVDGRQVQLDLTKPYELNARPDAEGRVQILLDGQLYRVDKEFVTKYYG